MTTSPQDFEDRRTRGHRKRRDARRDAQSETAGQSATTAQAPLPTTPTAAAQTPPSGCFADQGVTNGTAWTWDQ